VQDAAGSYIFMYIDTYVTYIYIHISMSAGCGGVGNSAYLRSYCGLRMAACCNGGHYRRPHCVSKASVLHCVALCCSLFRCVAVCSVYSTGLTLSEASLCKYSECVAVCCSVLQFVSVCCSVVQCIEQG